MVKLYTPYSVVFLVSYILITTACSCHSGKETIPQAYLGFEIDTTIVEITDLPKVINESSGIIHWADKLWLHNDSKKQAALFAINQQGELLRTVQLTDRENIDWEDITQDEDYIYIGDYGNNHGNRKDLAIYKINKSDIESGASTVVSAGIIEFSYPDQSDFSGPTHGHNYDCEAMIVVGDSLYLFSKNFEDRHSKLYSLPKNPGTYVANLKDRFDVKGNITGADINQDNGEVSLVGYYYNEGTFYPFVWFFWDYPGQQFFKGKHERFNFNFTSQIEGVCYHNDGVYICAESTRMDDGKLYYQKR